jgi:lysozyme
VTLTTAILDLSHYEHGARIDLAAQSGLVAVVAKCTMGKDWLDPSFHDFRDATLAAGLPLGAYHCATGTSAGDDQADWFLSKLPAGALPCVDWETWSSGAAPCATVEAFAARVEARLQRLPVLYTSKSFVVGSRVPKPGSILARCPLWVCSYAAKGTAPQHFPVAGLSPDWFLWQYTDGHYGPTDVQTFPRTTPGLGLLADRSAYAGTPEQLRAAWLAAGRV